MLVFARHGECVANTERRYIGRAESPLTSRGERQAARVADALASDLGLRIGRVLSSPLGRALQTANQIAAALGRRRAAPLEVELDQRFVELDYGDYEGTRVGEMEIRPVVPWREDPKVPIPHGESLVDAGRRVEEACAELFAAASAVADVGEPSAPDVVVVSHVVPIKLAVCWALGAPPETVWRMDLAVASVTRIATSGARPRLDRYNEHSFLGAEASPPIWR